MKKNICITLLSVWLTAMLCLTACSGGSTPAETEANTKPVINDKGVLTKADYVNAYEATLEILFGKDAVDTTADTAADTAAEASADTKPNSYYTLGGYLFFLRNLYASEEFEQTEAPIHLTASYTLTVSGAVGEDAFDGEASGSLDMVMEAYRGQGGWLRTHLYQATDDENFEYIQIDLYYDFEADVMHAFELSTLVCEDGTYTQFENLSYDGDSIRVLDSDVQDDAYQTALESADWGLVAIQGSAGVAKEVGDYSKQYKDAMVAQIKLLYPQANVQ